jgi:hypothetical protein
MSKLNFQSLPSEMPSNLVEAGMHRLKIKDAKIEISSNKGSTMLVVENTVVGHSLTVTDRYSVFDADGNPIQFGQYKLRKLLEVINVIPEDDFTLNILPRMIKNKEYIAELVEETYNDKTYLNVGYPDTFAPVDVENITPQDFNKTETAEIENVEAVIEDDEEI